MPSSRVLPLLSSLAAIGCSPYDPELGAQPFLCGDQEPRCPDGYQCIERIGADEVCLREAAVADAGGDGGLSCSGDTLEPNETIEAPTLVPIPGAGETYTLTAVTCPTTDRDIYRFIVDVTGKSVRIEVNHDSAAGQLALALLNATGTAIGTGTPTNNETDKLRVDSANLVPGIYYGRVQSMGGWANTYEIVFTVTANPLPP